MLKCEINESRKEKLTPRQTDTNHVNDVEDGQKLTKYLVHTQKRASCSSLLSPSRCQYAFASLAPA